MFDIDTLLKVLGFQDLVTKQKKSLDLPLPVYHFALFPGTLYLTIDIFLLYAGIPHSFKCQVDLQF